MSDKIKIEIGKTYLPKKKASSENEIIGDSWKAWRQNGQYFYECDVGHFASKFAWKPPIQIFTQNNVWYFHVD